MRNLTDHSWAKSIAMASAFAGFMLFAGVSGAHANEAVCQHKVEKADHHLHEAAEHHGWESRQAADARVELAHAREYCWSTYHKWWDEDGHRWHPDRDWDEHDHDHR